DGAGLGEVGGGGLRSRDEVSVRHLDGDPPLQLVVMGQVHEAKAASPQHLLDPVAADVGRKGWRGFRDRRRLGASRLVRTGLVSLAHGLLGTSARSATILLQPLSY